MQEVVGEFFEEIARHGHGNGEPFVTDGDRRLFARRELNLRDVAVVAQDLHRLGELMEIDAVLFLEFLADVVG